VNERERGCEEEGFFFFGERMKLKDENKTGRVGINNRWC